MSSLAFYIPADTWLHRLHIGAKLVVVAAYIGVTLTIRTPLALLCICLLAVLATLLLGLPLRQWVMVLVAMLLLGLEFIVGWETTLVARFVFGFGKVVCLSSIIDLFTMTTRTRQVLQHLQWSGSGLPGLGSALYLVNTTLAVVPSIQYDLQRARDAETLRRGTKLRFYSLNSWVTVLTIVLVRAMSRSERLANTVIDRGLFPSDGLVPLASPPMHWRDLFLAIVATVPAVILVVALR